MLWQLLLMSSIFSASALNHFYDDQRCRCFCPKTNTIINSTEHSIRTLYIAYVPRSKCNCYGVILPRVSSEIRDNAQSFCPRCDCKYETRNTTVIMVVVILVLWMIILLIGFYIFYTLFEVFTKREPNAYNDRRRNSYETENLLAQDEDTDYDERL